MSTVKLIKQSGSSMTKNSMEDFFLFFKNNIYLFAVVDLCRGIWDPQSSLQPALSFVVTCGIQFPDQGLNPCPLLWEHRGLATGPPEKSPWRTFQSLTEIPEATVSLGQGICTISIFMGQEKMFAMVYCREIILSRSVCVHVCVCCCPLIPKKQATTNFAQLAVTLNHSSEGDVLSFPLANSAQKRLCTAARSSANLYFAFDTFLDGFRCWSSVSNDSLDSRRETGPQLAASLITGNSPLR